MNPWVPMPEMAVTAPLVSSLERSLKAWAVRGEVGSGTTGMMARM